MSTFNKYIYLKAKVSKSTKPTKYKFYPNIKMILYDLFVEFKKRMFEQNGQHSEEVSMLQEKITMLNDRVSYKFSLKMRD